MVFIKGRNVVLKCRGCSHIFKRLLLAGSMSFCGCTSRSFSCVLFLLCVCVRYQVVSVCRLLGVDKWRWGRELQNKVLGGREVGGDVCIS